MIRVAFGPASFARMSPAEAVVPPPAVTTAADS